MSINSEIFQELKTGNIDEFLIKYPRIKDIISKDKILRNQFKEIVELRNGTIDQDLFGDDLSDSDVEIVYETIAIDSTANQNSSSENLEIIEVDSPIPSDMDGNESSSESLNSKEGPSKSDDNINFDYFTSKRFKKSSNESSSPNKITKDLSKKNDDNEQSSSANDNERVYYSKYLLHIVQLLEIDPHKINNLLDSYDREIINKFKNYSKRTQEFYTRMLKRKLRWLNQSKITSKMTNFNKTDIKDIIEFLKNDGFIKTDIYKENLEVILNLLQLSQLKILSKEFKLKDNLKKEILITNLLQQQKDYKPIENYFTNGKNCKSPLKKKSLELLGDVFKLNELPLKVFYRVILLTSYAHYYRSNQNEDCSVGPVRIQNELVKWYGLMQSYEKFPQFEVNIVMSPFQHRKALISYENALEIHDKMKSFDKANPPEEALQLTLEIKEKFNKIINDDKIIKYFSSLPLYLRRYSAGAEYAYILFKYGIKFLKKIVPTHLELPLILLLLINQSLFMNHRKDQFYEELLLYWSKGKQLDQIAQNLMKVSEDPNLNLIQKQILFITWQERLLKTRNIDKEIKNSLKENWVLISLNLQQVPERFYQALMIPDGRPGAKAVYKRFNSNAQETVFLGVEDFALAEYKFTLNFDGKHCEINGVRTLFVFFFWDIIYENSQMDVFHSQLQQQPLDLSTNEFYEKRKHEIDERLKLMENWTLTEIRHIVESIYEEKKDTTSLADWRLFQSSNEIVTILECMGMNVFSKICERLVKYYHDVNSGFPDLLLYNIEKKECKFVEVKGPKDTLSPKQILWLQFLISISAPCEICYIETNDGLKRKRKAD